MGFLFFIREEFTKAHEHLNRAHLLFTSLKDAGGAAQVDVERPLALAEEHHRCRLFGDRVPDARGVVAQLAVGGVDLDLARPKRPPDAPQVRRIDAGEDARHQQHRHGRLRR